MRAWISIVVLAACGRIGFDPVGGAGTAGDGGRGSDSGATMCPAACTNAGGTCMGTDCVIPVTGGGDLTCPPGLVCVFNCNTSTSCSQGTLDCTSATCTINCNVGGSCTGEQFLCPGGTCTYYCHADNTCNSNVFTCSGGGSCDLECCGSNLACGGNSGALPHVGTCP